jgi:predicted transcriptional regulator
MPLIPARHVEEKDTLSLRLVRPLHERLKQYAEFIQSPKDYVMSHALSRLFRQDKEFATWLEARPAAPAASRLLEAPATTEPSTHAGTRVRTGREV